MKTFRKWLELSYMAIKIFWSTLSLSQGSVVDIATGYGLDDREVGLRVSIE
jgi:hypothetical protein